jgi:5-methylcytosine-specific restriction endonuclease McrA
MMYYQGYLFEEDRQRARRSVIYGTPEFRRAYRVYTRSPEWKSIRRKIRMRCNGHCERCGAWTAKLQVHHLTYDRFRHERLEDLQGLCSSCHVLADKLRESRNRQSSMAARAHARYLAAENTYFTKKYGEDWRLDCTVDDSSAQEFDSWLEQKREETYY